MPWVPGWAQSQVYKSLLKANRNGANIILGMGGGGNDIPRGMGAIAEKADFWALPASTS